MRLPRVSIAALMAIVLLFAVTFAALHAATENWSRAMVTLAIGSCGVALLGRQSGLARDRVTWNGYLIFGGGYLALCIGPWCDEHIMPHLLTTPFMDEQYSRLHYSPSVVDERVWTADGGRGGFAAGRVFGEVAAGTYRFDVSHDRGTTALYSPDQIRATGPDGYRRLCHSALSPWIGLLGALLARWFIRRDRETPAAAGN